MTPGHAACDRCTKQQLLCDLPSARLADLSRKVGETSIPQIDNLSLFKEDATESHIPQSLASMSCDDWKEIRNNIGQQVFSVLATSDLELWEVGQFHDDPVLLCMIFVS